MPDVSYLAAVRESYDTVASDYFEQVKPPAELDPLSRGMLNVFAEVVRTAGLGPVADLGCGPGKVTQLLVTTGGAYDPDGDAVVQDELAVEAAAAEAREAEQLRLQQLADRADEIERLVQEDVLAGTEPREVTKPPARDRAPQRVADAGRRRRVARARPGRAPRSLRRSGRPHPTCCRAR